RVGPGDRPRHEAPAAGLLAQVRTGLAAVLGNPYLRVICLEAFTYNLFSQFSAALVVLYALHALHLSVGALGLYVALGGLGAVAGSVVAPMVIRLVGFGPAFLAGTAVACAAPVLIPLAAPGSSLGGPLIAASYLLAGLGVTVSVVGSITLRQTAAPPGVLARVNAVMRLASYSALPLGAVLAGAIASTTSVRTALFVGAAGLTLPVLILLASPVPRLRASFQAAPAEAAEPAAPIT